MRLEIVKNKLSELNLLNGNNIVISKEIQTFICSEIKSSVRELVGALNRIHLSQEYIIKPIACPTRIILKDLLNIYENKVTIDNIQTIVCKYFKISKNEMLSSEDLDMVRPRQTAIYLAKMLTSKSLPELEDVFQIEIIQQ